MKNKLKLFIWTGFMPDYTDGLAFAVAESEEEAKNLVNKEWGFEIGGSSWGDLEVRSLSKKVGRSVAGGG